MNPKILKFRKQILKLQQRLKRSLNKNKRKSYTSQLNRKVDWIHKDFKKNRQYEIAGIRCPICGKSGNWRNGQEFDHMMICYKDLCDYPVWIPGRHFKRWGW